MSQGANHFQVSWHELRCTFKQQASFYERAYDEISKTVGVASKAFSCSSSRGSYNLEENIEDGRNDCATILRGSNGSFKSGHLTAILGASGAGKTTLLNFISRRTIEGYDGSLIVTGRNGRKITVNAIAQTDHLPEYLTVRENLTFASKLKNPTLDGLDHEKNVARVSHLLGLDECLDTRTQKISGGQQKRLSIAQELLSKPDVLILDEPTSGLDSSTCLHTLGVLKDVVRSTKEPIAILLTIHQPQSEVFELFDKVYVMATGGLVIYDGPPSECVEFVDKYSGLKMPADDYNPASFLIDIASGEFGSAPIEALRRQVDKQFQREHPNHTDDSRDSVQRQPTKPELHVDSRLVKGSSTDQGHFCYKTSLLTKRCWMSMVREQHLLIARILLHIMLPIGMTILMGREPGRVNACPNHLNKFELRQVMLSDDLVSSDTKEELLLTIENVANFFITTYSAASVDIGVMTLIFLMDLRSSLKEYSNGWYSRSSYLLARLLSNVPLDVALPTTTMVLLYWLSDQNTGNGDLPYAVRVLLSSVGVIISTCAVQCLGMAIGAIYVDQITTALFVSQGAILPFVMLSGFISRTKNMTAFVRALSVTSIFKHCLEVIYIARFGFNVCNCRAENTTFEQSIDITGVPGNLRSFSKFLLDTQSEVAVDSTNLTQVADYKDDVFQMIAKQLNLYNTFGIEVQSCKDVVPFQLYDFKLTDRDLIVSMSCLFALLAIMVMFLFLALSLTLSRKAAL